MLWRWRWWVLSPHSHSGWIDELSSWKLLSPLLPPASLTRSKTTVGISLGIFCPMFCKSKRIVNILELTRKGKILTQTLPSAPLHPDTEYMNGIYETGRPRCTCNILVLMTQPACVTEKIAILFPEWLFLLKYYCCGLRCKEEREKTLTVRDEGLVPAIVESLITIRITLWQTDSFHTGSNWDKDKENWWHNISVDCNHHEQNSERTWADLTCRARPR